METQNQNLVPRIRRTQARGGLLDFLIDIGGTVSTYHQHFKVLETEGGYTIVHRGGRWLMRFQHDGQLEILARNGTISVTDEIRLNGRRVGRICMFGWACFSADVLRLMAFTFVALWYWRVREQALRRLVCMLRFGESQASAGVIPCLYKTSDTSQCGGPDEYIYGDLYGFLIELGRALGTSKLDHKVSRSPNGYVIAHRGEKWRAELNLNGDVEIITNNGRVRIVGSEIHLDNGTFDEVCEVGLAVCLGAHEIRIMLFTYIVLWYLRIDEREVIWRLAQMVRPCQS